MQRSLFESLRVRIALAKPLERYSRASRTRIFIRLLALALIDGIDVEKLVVPSGGLKALASKLDPSRSDVSPSRDAQLKAAMVMASIFGWQLFAPFVLSAVGISRPTPADTERLLDLVLSLLDV